MGTSNLRAAAEPVQPRWTATLKICTHCPHSWGLTPPRGSDSRSGLPLHGLTYPSGTLSEVLGGSTITFWLADLLSPSARLTFVWNLEVDEYAISYHAATPQRTRARLCVAVSPYLTQPESATPPFLQAQPPTSWSRPESALHPNGCQESTTAGPLTIRILIPTPHLGAGWNGHQATPERCVHTTGH